MKKKPGKKVTAPPAGATLIIAAGGTGGHITPGISIAERWLSEGGKVILATLMKNIEYPDIVLLARNDLVSIVAYDAPRLTKNPLELIGFFRRFLSAYRLLKRAAETEGAAAVIGMGGYSSFPAVLYAIMNRKPLFLCEQNAHWGIVTRAAKFFSRAVFLSFPESKKLPPKFILTGNPLRSMFAGNFLKPAASRKAGKKTIFFIGGSQGATDINSLYRAFAAHPEAAKYQCTVATGKSAYEELKASARRQDTLMPFVEDMPAAFKSADFVIARCGSGTLFEILWSGKPAFLMPYPHAAANHQRANADALTPQMPAVIYDQRPFSSQDALPQLLAFLNHPPATAWQPPDTRPEEKITRYINQKLSSGGLN